MKIVSRYLLKELISPFLLGIVLFTFVLLFGQFLQLMDLIVNQGVSAGNLILFTLLGIPETFVLTVPMSMVMATLMAYARLAADHEIIIFRLSGFPLRTLLLPTLLLAFCLSIGLLGFRQYISPPLANYRQQTLVSLRKPDPARLMKAKTYQQFGDFTLYASEVNGRHMTGVHIEDHRTSPPKDIYSERGTWKQTENDYRLILRDGSIYQRGDDKHQFRVLSFQETTLRFSPDEPQKKKTEVTNSLTELWEDYQHSHDNLRELQKKQSSGTGNVSEEQIQRAKKLMLQRALEFHREVSFPMATFFLVLISAPIGMISRREGKSMGFTVSLAIIFVYYMLSTFAEPLAINGWLHPALAMWLANLLFGLLGLGLLGKLAWKGE